MYINFFPTLNIILRNDFMLRRNYPKYTRQLKRERERERKRELEQKLERKHEPKLLVCAKLIGENKGERFCERLKIGIF